MVPGFRNNAYTTMTSAPVQNIFLHIVTAFPTKLLHRNCINKQQIFMPVGIKNDASEMPANGGLRYITRVITRKCQAL